jgi:hypothetical protein
MRPWIGALLLAVSLLCPGIGTAARRIPLKRRLVDTKLARDMMEGRAGPSLQALRVKGEEIPLGVEARWSKNRFELVRAEGPEEGQSLLAFDHQARRWWRVDACVYETGPLEVRRSSEDGSDRPGVGLLTRCPRGRRPNYSYFRLTPGGIERLARFAIPWAELDREVLASLHQAGLQATSADTSFLALTNMVDLNPREGAGRTSMAGELYVGRLEEFQSALDHADPTLGLTAREIVLARDLLPPGLITVSLNLLPGMVRVGEVGPLREQLWMAPMATPDRWVMPRPRKDVE